ncbi:hypothetical protein CH063_10939 [Colletotrichum higginsianum]|uniref:Spt6 acidic N-terminal domain-containing protein n=1 Tax=Colletotrichum higginsianum (strain IMI 349063) TaxID=759273 RepID=H1VJF1_COLHI|nr:hypothetical protein CH063_10939 [Colletotrichum higginsianum]
MRDFVDGEAEIDDEDEESIDEDVVSSRRRNAAPEDSSEEEEDDEDEEEARKIREGFIVDEDEEEEEGEDEDAHERKRKREHRDREEEEQLDEDDLELIGEQIERRAPTQPKFKRLKRGHRDEDDRGPERRGLEDMFSDDDEEANERLPGGRRRTRAPT